MLAYGIMAGDGVNIALLIVVQKIRFVSLISANF